MSSFRRAPSPPRMSSSPLSRSRTSATLPSTMSSTQRQYMSKSPFLDGDIYQPSASFRRPSPSQSSSTLPRTSSASSYRRADATNFDDLPLHLSSRLNESKDYLRSSPLIRTPSPSFRPSSASGHYEPRSAYAQNSSSSSSGHRDRDGHGHGRHMNHSASASGGLSNGVSSTLDPYVKEFESVYRSSTPTSTTYRPSGSDAIGRSSSPSSYSTSRSPIPGYRPSSEFRTVPMNETPIRRSNSPNTYREVKVDTFWPSTRTPASSYASSSHHGHQNLSASGSASVQTPSTETEYRSLASRVFSSDYKPDKDILDLDMDAKRLIAESEKTNRVLGLTVNSSVKMLNEMDEKLNEIEIRRKRRENSRTPDKMYPSFDLSVGLASVNDGGRKSPSASKLSPDVKDRIDRDSRSRERTPTVSYETDSNQDGRRDKKGYLLDENSNVVRDGRRDKPTTGTSDGTRDKKDANNQRKESVFEVEIDNERQVLDAVKRKVGDAKNDEKCDKNVDANKSRDGNNDKKMETLTMSENGNNQTPKNEQGIQSRINGTESVNPVDNERRSESKINCFNISSMIDGPTPTSFDESRRWSMSKKDQTPKAKYNYSFVALVAVVAFVIIIVAVNK